MKQIIALQEYTDKYISLYEGQIRNIENNLANQLIQQGIVAEHDESSGGGGGSSDWDDIENRPAIISSEGENSVLIGQIEQSDSYAEYPVLLTGDANTKIYSFTTSSPSITDTATVLKYQDKYYYIVDIATAHFTIELSKTLSSTEALSNAEATVIATVKIASGLYAVAEGYRTQALGNYAHAEGSNTRAVGNNSHAEGTGNRATGAASHAEGSNTKAVGNSAHAEGNTTQASGNYSHAEGNGTKATGAASHAEGANTIAASANQHVQGKYNIEDTEDTYAFIIGNGAGANTRSNALAMKWDGTFVLANGTEITPAQITALLALLN